MEREYFQKFVEAKESGLRGQAKGSLSHFIASFESLEEKAIWTKEYLERREYGHKIRHELYREIIFPVLLEGYRHHDSWALYWLAETIQNLYDCDELHQRIDHKTDFGLLRECFALDEGNSCVRVALLERLVRFFEYTIHEWPAGIIYPSHEGPDELLEELQYARQLDTEMKFSDFFEHVRTLLEEAKRRRAEQK